MVGHSWEIFRLCIICLQTAHDPEMPKLNKQVSIGGHF